jgi:dihydroflavonol-4-reductase
MAQHTSMSHPVLLLTGATGQIGRQVLSCWLATGNKAVITLRDPLGQWPQLQRWLAGKGVPTDTVECVATDFAREDFGWDAQAHSHLADVTCVVHLAAMWGWGLAWEQAESINVRASQRLHAWASHRGIAGPFVCACGYLSQIPRRLDSMGFRQRNVDWARAARTWGSYEVSKIKAYLEMGPSRMRPGDTPITWIHPATVIGDPRSPEVPDHSAIAGILRSIRRGMLRLSPGSASDVVPWVTGRYVSEYIVALLSSPGDAMVEHLLLDPRSLSLRRTIELISEAIGCPKPLGQLPTWLMRRFLSLPIVPQVTGVSAESLSFIVDALPDASTSVAWGVRHGVVHPDLRASLVATAHDWNRRAHAS